MVEQRLLEAAETLRAGLDHAPAVMTVDKLAALQRLNRKTVYEAIQRDEIPGVRRIGRAIRISRPATVVLVAGGSRPIAIDGGLQR